MAKLKKTGESNVSSQLMMGSIGERLKSARESRGLSLEDVYKAVKIHHKTLEALEKGRLESKLGETYVKAFLKSYSTFLGMDAEAVLKEYNSKKHAAASNNGPRSTVHGPRQSIDNRKKQAHKKNNAELIRAVMTTAALIAILAALAFGAVKISRFAKNTFSKIKISAVSNKKSEPVRESSKPPPSEPRQSAAEEIMPIPKQKTLTLALAASNDVWLKVTVDGKVAFHRILSKKSKETWKAEKEIRLAEIGKPEALMMSVNGKDIDFSKTPTRNILITHEGVDLEPK